MCVFVHVFACVSILGMLMNYLMEYNVYVGQHFSIALYVQQDLTPRTVYSNSINRVCGVLHCYRVSIPFAIYILNTTNLE